MKKTIQILVITILTAIVALIVILVFNPFDLRAKIIGGLVNRQFSDTDSSYESTDTDENLDTPSNEEADTQHPLLTEEQVQTLEGYGIDVSQLPSSITPEMEACFVEKLGEERTQEIVEGGSPSATEFLRARTCLNN